MKKTLLIILFVLGFSFVSFAQKAEAAKEGKKEVVILKPTFEINDLIFALQQLNTVEIVGQEVDAFLECKSLLTTNLKKYDEEKKKPADKVTLEMNAIIAQNTLNFVGRTKFSGALAERYKSFADAIFKAAEPFKKKAE